MSNNDSDTPWRTRQARWTIPNLTEAVHLQCRNCNQEDRFLDSNDCVSPFCPLFPYRPGSCRPEVDGVKRATRQRRGCRGNLLNLRNKPTMRPPDREIAPRREVLPEGGREEA
jgi:hypothetical protein